MDISRVRFPMAVLIGGLLLGLIGNLLFYGQPLGISVPLFLLLVLIAGLLLVVVQKAGAVWSNLWLIVPLLFLAVMSAVRAAPLLRFLNIGGALLLLVLLAGSLGVQPILHMNLGGYVKTVAEGLLLSAIFPFSLLRRALEDARRSNRSGHTARRVLIGLLIAVPLLCVFSLLFASADLIFGGYVDRLLAGFNIPDLIGHSILTLILAWASAGGLAYALSRTRPEAAQPAGEPLPENEIPPQPPAPASGRLNLLGMLEAGIVLFSVNALFLVFVLIQFAALFGGEAFLRSQGLTYSEYARRGFFELLAVALITLALILSLDFVTQRKTRSHRLIFLLGSGLMIALTIVILASAFQRMQLYELAYGFTTMRVYPHIFMIWLAVLLAYVLVFLILDRPRLSATGALVAALGFMITLNVLNPDAFIVRQNVARYERGEPLDVDYLGSLSEDAVPLLIPLLYEHGPEIGAQVGPWLRWHLDQLDQRQTHAGWPAYHTSINRAYRMLDRSRELIEQFDLPESRAYID